LKDESDWMENEEAKLINEGEANMQMIEMEKEAQ